MKAVAVVVACLLATSAFTNAQVIFGGAGTLVFPSLRQYIEDIYFFEANTKYISSRDLKASKFSIVRSTSENLDVFKS